MVVLVVAADDGVMPQTVEAIAHAKAAHVPIIVAVNKIDKGDANPTRVKTELLQYEIQVEDMGGETQAIEVSATKAINLDKLEEAILLQSELLDLKANPDRAAEGAVIEAKLDRGRGPVATVLVAARHAEGRRHRRRRFRMGPRARAAERSRRNRRNRRSRRRRSKCSVFPARRKRATNSSSSNPMRAPAKSPNTAPASAAKRVRPTSSRQTLDQLLKTRESGEKRLLPLVLKSDVQGSSEAIQGALSKLCDR